MSERREEVIITGRITKLHPSKQNAGWVAVLPECVGGETGGNNGLFTWL